ncbi:MAG TPA: MBL fold metallo-hydrolase [Nitrospira sp.]|nr:MBL fold metallo-hydrolase [Nitrospira sp.]
MQTNILMILPTKDRSPQSDTGSILFIGNATVVIRFGGFTILTDPTFIHRHEQVSIGYGMHSTRLTDPALDIEQLPPVDLVVLSHFHGDHFDQVAERDLDKSLPIVTTREAADALHRRGFRQVKPLETWSSVSVEKGEMRLRITAMPGRHGPPLVHFAMPDVMGSMLEFDSPTGRSFRLYITGDTLVMDDLRHIPRRYPDIDLALLHLGGTRVLGVLVTMDAAQGVELIRMVGPRRAIPIHYDDYDVFTSSLSDFQQAVEAAGLKERVQYLQRGETHAFQASAKRAAA